MGMMVNNIRESPCIFYYEGSESKIHAMPEPCTGIQIANDSLNRVMLTVNGLAQTIKSGEVFSMIFLPFVEFSIVTNGDYRLWGIL